jgi:inorganic pyrophosphatase
MHPVYFENIPPMGKKPDVIHAVIEIAKGQRNKIEFDKELQAFRLDRYLYSASVYPSDYGFIPQTLADDGDPLDVLVMVNEPTFAGCIIKTRVIGMYTMLDHGREDSKILGVPDRDPLFDDVRHLEDVPSHFLKEVQHFFSTYKQLEGVTVQPGHWHGADDALQTVKEAVEMFCNEGKPS